MLNLLETVDIAVESPDRSLIARMRGTDGLEVHIQQMSYHNDETLVTQLRHALPEALRVFHEACDEITAEAKASNGNAADSLRPQQRARLDDYLTEVADIVVVGKSPSGRTRVKRSGDGAIDIRIQAGTIGALQVSAVQQEINSAIHSAHSQLAYEDRQLYREWFPRGRISK